MRKALMVLAVVALVVGAIVPATAHAQDTDTTGDLIVRIRDDVTGEPAPYVPIRVLGPEGAAEWDGREVLSDESGDAFVPGLLVGSYTVNAGHHMVFSSDYLFEVYEDLTEADYLAFDPVDILAGETTEITMNMALGGTLGGTITHAWTGEPVAGVVVRPNVDFVSTSSNADGTYGMGPLGGLYDVTFSHDDFDTLVAQSITVPAGTETTLDVELTPKYGTPYATIHGFVCVDGDGDEYCDMWSEEPRDDVVLAGVTVRVTTPGGDVLATGTTDPWGGFVFDGLTPGTMVVELDEATLPDGMTGRPPTAVNVEVGHNEWAEVVFFVEKVQVDLHLSVKATSEVVLGQTTEVVVTITFVRSVPAIGSFVVGPVEMHASLPDGLAYNGHTATGSFQPESGRWVVPAIELERSAQLKISVTGQTVGTMTVSAEVVGVEWVDPDSWPDDGRGDDFDQAAVTVVRSPAVISGVVWLDRNDNGVRSASEPGMAGIEVVVNQLATGDVVALLTDRDGAFSISGLVAGNYRVVLGDLPADHTAPDGGAVTVLAEPGKRAVEFRVVYAPARAPIPAPEPLPAPEPEVTSGTVSGVVWLDDNENGMWDVNEALAPNVRITMVDLSTNEQVTLRFAEGRFTFVDVPPGRCDLSLDASTLPEGWEADPTDPQQVLVAAGEEVTADFRLVPGDGGIPLPWLIGMVAAGGVMLIGLAVGWWWTRRTGRSLFGGLVRR